MSLPIRRVTPDPAPAPAEISEQRLQQIIEALHARAEDAANLGRRTALRLPVEGFAHLQPLSPTPSTPHAVGIYDMSRSGIAIVAQDPIAPGTRFKLLFRREDDRRPIEVLCTARHSRQAGQGYIIGAEFGVSWLSALAAAI